MQSVQSFFAKCRFFGKNNLKEVVTEAFKSKLKIFVSNLIFQDFVTRTSVRCVVLAAWSCVLILFRANDKCKVKVCQITGKCQIKLD